MNTLAGEWQLLWASQVNLYISITKAIWDFYACHLLSVELDFLLVMILL